MRVLLTSEARLERTPDGTVWAAPAYGSALWSRYLDVFSGVLLAARVAEVDRPSAGSVVASRPDVAFCALPPYSGLGGLTRNLRRLERAIAGALHTCPAAIVRSPSPVAFIASRIATASGRPYGAEIVGDPDGVFSAGAFHHPLRAPVRRLATSAQRRLAQHAVAAIFVTREALQRKYPTGGRAYAASDVALDDAAFAAHRPHGNTQPLTLVSVAGLDQPYKGMEVLLNAVALLKQGGHAVKLRIVGGGGLMAGLQRRVVALGIEEDVEFLGQLDHEGVRQTLDSANLFVLPSLTEGMPRALLEAMARGLPAIGSAVGGVPELLPPECLVPARNEVALADRIREAMTDAARRTAMGERNREVARAYHDRLQAPVRRAFLLDVRAACAARPEVICA